MFTSSNQQRKEKKRNDEITSSFISGLCFSYLLLIDLLKTLKIALSGIIQVSNIVHRKEMAIMSKYDFTELS